MKGPPAVEEIGGGGEDEAPHVVLHSVLKQVQPIRHVIANVEKGVLHRLADQGVGSKVHDGFR